MSQTIKDEIKEILSALVSEDFTIDDDQDLTSLSGVDSLLILQFMVMLEKKFKVDFSSGNIEEIFKNINSLANYLESNKNEKT